MSDISNPTPSGTDLNPKNSDDAILEALMGASDAQRDDPPVEEPAAEAQPDDDPVLESEASEQEQPEDSQVAEAQASDEEESLATMLGLADDQLVVDDDGNIHIATKINGKVGQTSLADLLKGYQFNQANNERAQALAAERKAFDEAQAEAKTRTEQRIQQAEGLAMMFQKKLTDEYQKVNWEELRRLDPGEFAAKQAEFGQRYQELQHAGQYMAQYREQQEADERAAADEARAKLLQEQRTIMLSNNPSWSDEAVFDKEMGALRGFVQSQYGFSEEDTRQVADARLIELIKDAHAFRAGKSVAAKKAVAPPPRMQRAANGRFTKSKKASRVDKLVAAAKQARGANKRDLQTDAVAALLLGEN